VISVNVANAQTVKSESRGTILIKALVKGEWRNCRLENVLYVPTFDHNLFLTFTVYKKGIISTGNDKQMTFEKNGHVVLMAVKRGRSFVLCIKQREVKHEKYEKCYAARTGNLREWHE